MRTRRNPGHRPAHAGAMLRDMVPAGWSKTRIARALGLSRYQLCEILAEKRVVTPNIALRLESGVGGSAQAWTEMQTEYDEWR